MTKHVHMSPPQSRENSAGPKLFRRILVLFMVGAALVWAGGNGQGETPVTKLATRISDRWDQKVTQAPHLLPLLRRADNTRSKTAMNDAGILGGQAAPSLGGRSKGARKAK